MAQVGEPWRFGWHPSELPRWLAARGFALAADESDAEMAALGDLDLRLDDVDAGE